MNPALAQWSNLFDVRDKVVYVPGGYGGIGAGICWAFAAAGAKVALSGRSLEKAKALASEINAAGGQALGLAVDALQVASLSASVDAVVRHFGRIDVLVNSLGIQREQKLLEVTEEAFDEVQDVNVKAAMFLGQACARHQIAAGRGGRHIHILSVRSQLAIRGRGYSSYVASKGALAQLVKQHAMELAPHRIHVNGVAPTFVHTQMVDKILADGDFKQRLLERIPLGRIAEPRDMAGPCLMLASSAANFITGQILYVDGGITASQ